MPLSDAAVVGQQIVAESNFGDGLREDWNSLDIETSSAAGNRTGQWKRGFIHANMTEYGFTYGSDENTANGDNFVAAAINYETQAYPDTRKPHPSGWSGLSVSNGILTMSSRPVDVNDAAEYDWARVKTNGLNSDGSDNGVLDRAKRAKYLGEMLSTYGRFAMSFGRYRWKVKTPYGADGSSDDVNQRSAIFPAAGWLLQDVPYGMDINGNPFGDGRTTYRPGRPNGGGILHEIDIHENFGESTTDVHQTVHTHVAGTPNGSSTSYPLTINRTQDLRSVWCEAGVDIFPEKIAFHLDGVYTHVVDTADEIRNGLPLYEPVSGAEYNQVMDSANAAKVIGRQTHEDGSTRYMRHVLISNLARDGKYPRDLARQVFLDANRSTPPHKLSVDMEIDYIEARPLIVDNPDEFPLSIKGVPTRADGSTAGVDTPAAPLIATDIPRRTEAFINIQPEAIAGTSFRANMDFPPKEDSTPDSPANYTYKWAVLEGVEIQGPDDQYDVVLNITNPIIEGARLSRSISCVVTPVEAPVEFTAEIRVINS